MLGGSPQLQRKLETNKNETANAQHQKPDQHRQGSQESATTIQDPGLDPRASSARSRALKNRTQRRSNVRKVEGGRRYQAWSVIPRYARQVALVNLSTPSINPGSPTTHQHTPESRLPHPPSFFFSFSDFIFGRRPTLSVFPFPCFVGVRFLNKGSGGRERLRDRRCRMGLISTLKKALDGFPQKQ